MKIQFVLALALATGLALGAVVTQSLHARTPPPAYFVAEIDEITDAKGFETLRKMGPANIAEAKMLDGRYLARTDNITALDGAAPKKFIMIAFDSMEKAKGYYESTKQITAMRTKVTKSRAFTVEGL